MKKNFFRFPKTIGILTMAAAGMLAVPQTSEAKPKFKDNRHRASHYSGHHRDYDRDRHRHSSYYSHPRSSFVLSFGTGYAGRGYYYGPPGASYYYNAPGVQYYATRSVVPRQYIVSPSYVDTGVAVQRALASRGYYHGAIDGAIGPMSSRAIARYQADAGLPVTGTITSSLLRSLGL